MDFVLLLKIYFGINLVLTLLIFVIVYIISVTFNTNILNYDTKKIIKHFLLGLFFGSIIIIIDSIVLLKDKWMVKKCLKN